MRWLWISLTAALLAAPAAAQDAPCVLQSWGGFLDPGPQAYEEEEVIAVEGGSILTVVFGDLEGPYAKRFLFLLDDGTCFTKALSVGSYAATNRFAIEAGDIPEGDHLFHIDLYAPGSHQTLGFARIPPSYDEAKALALEHLK